MSPEQEAELLRQQVAAAQASGDIGTILHLMAKTSELTPSDFIKKTVGNILFVYYVYLENFHIKPKDLEDIVDGLLYLDAHNFIQKQQYEAEMAKMRNKKHG
jgi:hypothetical protein